MNFSLNYLNDFFALIFPNFCSGCGNTLSKGEEVICTFCQFNLPQTNFHLEKNNPVEKKFWGRVNITQAAAFYFFQKASKIQHLLHELKYKGKKEIGVKLGKMFGSHLKNSEFSSVDIIIPVPLHPSKERKRGYNQSDLLAQGLSETLNKPWSREIVRRVKATESQTKKTRMERWKNVEEIFEVKKPELLHDKHLLLVDDVITTGSTLEACGNALLQAKNSKLSIAVIAFAQH